MKIRTIRNMQELENIRAFWDGWQSHPNIDIDHFKLVCRLRQEVVSPHVTVVECDGQPSFLLIGRLEKTRLVPSIGYFKPVRISAKVIMVLYHGLLGNENGKIGEALVRHMRSLLASGEADVVVFQNLFEHSLLLQALLYNVPSWWCEKRLIWSTHWKMDVPQEPGSLSQKMRSKHRSWILKKQRELESAFQGKVSWRWITNFNDIPDLCKRLEVVAARTYQRGLSAGFLDNEENRKRFALFASRGKLRVQILEIDKKIQAFWIGEIYRDTFFSSTTGYDPNIRQFEPGTLLFMHMVDELAQEGIRHFDFGLGDAFYKSRFGDQHWRETTVRLFAPTAKGLVLRSSLWFFGLLDSFGRHLFKKFGMLERLKTVWRRRLVSTKPENDE